MRLASDGPAGATQEWPINLIAGENSPSVQQSDHSRETSSTEIGRRVVGRRPPTLGEGSKKPHLPEGDFRPAPPKPNLSPSGASSVQNRLPPLSNSGDNA